MNDLISSPKNIPGGDKIPRSPLQNKRFDQQFSPSKMNTKPEESLQGLINMGQQQIQVREAFHQTAEADFERQLSPKAEKTIEPTVKDQ